MSIRDDAYRLCKGVWASLDRDRIKDLIWELNADPNFQQNANIEKNRSSYGYASIQLGAQILGYLVIHRDKAELQDNYPPLRWIETLDDDERDVLEGVHEEFVNLDKKCTMSLLDRIPYYLLDPYNKYKYEIFDVLAKIDLLENDSLQSLVRSFGNHPGISIAQETYENIDEEINPERLAHDVLRIDDAIMNTGPLKSPEKLSNFILGDLGDPSSKNKIRLLSAITCIRASLGVLNELVYQAVLSKTLPVLNEENIIGIGPLHGHAISNGFSLICQPDDENVNLGTMDRSLVLFRDANSDYPIDLCRVEWMNFQASDEIGDTIEIHLREIDENLNPYHRLLQSISLK